MDLTHLTTLTWLFFLLERLYGAENSSSTSLQLVLLFSAKSFLHKTEKTLKYRPEGLQSTLSYGVLVVFIPNSTKITFDFILLMKTTTWKKKIFLLPPNKSKSKIVFSEK